MAKQSLGAPARVDESGAESATRVLSASMDPRPRDVLGVYFLERRFLHRGGHRTRIFGSWVLAHPILAIKSKKILKLIQKIRHKSCVWGTYVGMCVSIFNLKYESM
jgi:hypothetical protein